MIDIALIREKPEWVKEQIAKLNDKAALQRIDTIVELDKQRRALLTEAEAASHVRSREIPIPRASGRMRARARRRWRRISMPARSARA